MEPTERLSLEAALDLPLDNEPMEDDDAPAGDEIQDATPIADEEDWAVDDATLSDEDEAVEDDEDEDAPETVSVVPAPKSWGDEEAKALWVRLPPEVQRQVATREEQRDQATQRLLSNAGEERKKAVEATRALGTFAQRAEQTLQSLEQAYQTAGYEQWTNQDWYKLSVEDPGLYVQHREYANLLQQQRQQAAQIRANAMLAQQEAFAEEQANLLHQHAPDVLRSHNEITQYLGETFGYTPDQVRLASAADRLIAYKAMMFDRMSAQAKQKAATSKNQARPAPKAFGASAAQTSTPAARKKVDAQKAFKAKPSLENAMRMLPDF
ncbi:MAG TPA: hypothetical protein DCL48_08965 [Alphaproteobacteria bacterium]|nr:hypothetical protein [Alphaproteobacteria bacterium]